MKSIQHQFTNQVTNRFTSRVISRLSTALLLSCSLLAVTQHSQAQSAAAGDSVVLSKTVQKIDQRIGSGPAAKPGDTAVVAYTGWLHDPLADNERGMRFDSTGKSAPFSFVIGQGKVIKGWEQGILGMQAGGKRSLIIPSELGYGARGAGAQIPPYATLIFDIELLELR